MYRGGRHSTEAGFTYIALIFAIALFGIGSVRFSVLYSEQQKRAREEELLRIGKEYADAIRSYYLASPGLQPEFPKQLSDLLTDHRFVGTRHHLRRIYIDPMTLETDWGVVRDSRGGIQAVYSRSLSEPKKRADFPAWVQITSSATTYSDWKFQYAQLDPHRR